MRSWPVTYADPAEFEAGFSRLRAEFEIPESFPAAVDAYARQVEPWNGHWTDLTDTPFVAIDPAGARDLDQVFHAHRSNPGYTISYGIADVGAFVAPGDPVDVEAHLRGVTVYSPDMRSPLHPVELSEGSASLLPDADRPAVVWTLELDPDGRLDRTTVRRAMVRNRAALSYRQAQDLIDGVDPPESLRLLAEIGRLRHAIEEERGGVSLNLPSQYVTKHDGTYHIGYETTLPVEGWNAQISLLAGMAAAHLMIEAGIGLLRTLPPPDEKTLNALRRKSRVLGVPFDDSTDYATWVRSLDPRDGRCLALLNQATTALRGAGYVAFSGSAPAGSDHAAIASPYAHVTAPLRRLADRYTSELAVHVCAGTEPPDWVVEGLERMPDVMRATVRKERRFGRALVDFTEALALQHRRGERFDAVVVDVESNHVTLQLREPAVVTDSNRTDLRLGAEVEVELVECDPEARQVLFGVV